MIVQKAERILERCTECMMCKRMICQNPTECIGCGACVQGCPNRAIKLSWKKIKSKKVSIRVNGMLFEVPSSITLEEALKLAGFTFSDDKVHQFLCRTGGCYACSVLVNGKLSRSCVRRVEEGMDISTTVPEDVPPLRIIHGPAPHTVGGKATPWWLKRGREYIEVAIWTAGCNLRCPQCQNFTTTYDANTAPCTPAEAARMVVGCSRRYGVSRVAISGGEPTLNRRWLIRYFEEVKRIAPDIRLHLDSNGTLLTPDYIDELVQVGVQDIGVEPKAVRVKTFSKITGIEDEREASSLLSCSWNAARYIAENYKDKVFLGIGLPYNRELVHNIEEVEEFGKKVAEIDREIQVCVLDYFPAFRRMELERPSVEEMLKIHSMLKDLGLKNVIVQTSIGHFGPQ
jgi:pyruvate formate lyase activating enzyme